eukprot:gene48076-64510_t
MGTIDKIVEALQRITEDKKNQVTDRYIEHSSWLSKEFLQLRQLIQQDSSSNQTDPQNEEEDDTNEIEFEEIPPTESVSDDTDNKTRQKRKSPETCLDGIRTSPDSKRSSADYDELASAAGLPSDLNKLKKEVLLLELEKRGVTTMTMKSLKKDLIDVLK